MSCMLEIGSIVELQPIRQDAELGRATRYNGLTSSEITSGAIGMVIGISDITACALVLFPPQRQETKALRSIACDFDLLKLIVTSE